MAKKRKKAAKKKKKVAKKKKKVAKKKKAKKRKKAKKKKRQHNELAKSPLLFVVTDFGGLPVKAICLTGAAASYTKMEGSLATAEPSIFLYEVPSQYLPPTIWLYIADCLLAICPQSLILFIESIVGAKAELWNFCGRRE